MKSKLDAVTVERLVKRKRVGMHADGDGLYLRIRDTGGASWTLRYRFGGRDVWMPLGDANNMPLATARKEKRSARVLIDQGQNPLRLKREAKAAAARQGPFRQLAEKWYASEIESRYKHPEAVRRALNNHVLPKLGRFSAEEITPSQCAELLDGVRHKHPAMANDLLRYLQAIFAYARRRHAVQISPVADFSSRLDAGGVEKARSRALSRDEIAALFRSIAQAPTFGGDNALAIKLLLALCVRKSELLGAKWREFELEEKGKEGPVWHLPSVRTKTGAALDIPLVPSVVDWLRALKVLAGASEYVFPARRKDVRARQQHVGTDTLNVAMSRLTHDIPHFTLHDLRRTARTQLASLGIRREIAERCLNHKVGGVEGTYDRHEYFQERRAALQLWTALLSELEAGRTKVVPIGAKSKR